MIPYQQEKQYTVSNFRQTSSALNRRRSGGPRTRTAQENVTAVADSIEQSPRRSIRKHAFALHMSATSVHRILHKSLHMHPYKIMVVQELSERDYKTRTKLSRDILQSIPPTSVTICSDEAHFHLSGMVNKQNFRYWSQNNPRELHQRPLHSPKFTVWCAMGSFGVWGPHFFEEEGLLHQTVTVKCSRGFFVQKLLSCLLIMNPMMYDFNKMVPRRIALDVHSEFCRTCFQVMLFLCGVTLGGLHVPRI